MPRVPPHEWTGRRIRELRVRFADTQPEFCTRLVRASATPERPQGMFKCRPQQISSWENDLGRPGMKYVQVFRLLDPLAPAVRGIPGYTRL